MVGITIGDPSGIGPEVILKSILQLSNDQLSRILLIGSTELFRFWANYYGFDLNFRNYQETKVKGIPVVDVGIDFGKISLEDLVSSEESSARVSLESINKSIELLKSSVINSVVNSPVSKERISRIHQGFKGHTGYYAKHFDITNYNMAFYSDDFRVVLLTDHIPLMEVGRYVKKDNIKRTILNSYNWARTLDRNDNPLVGICGLNPHAGEGGTLGNEEKEILDAIRELGMDVIGPLPPDTAFVEYKKRKLNCLVCLYHDQGLIGFKLLHFTDGINVTLGLPFVRCSPDHGTAFDIVGKGVANNDSMTNAIKYALRFEPEVKRYS
ncbi:MAG: 4-hydroxythreonine-4-phosphate dehydrogenase PdxA [Spirochaetia bacterium]|nr:4-hydroxythreonine-4-phosphate dehydrogenase PdxA [Spirochaetota bacterium]MCX8096783.1 4-hydroxythreonine-4-phosphate dehydrogenase PdxA [Spirochaetota bacterium]MDW8112557.1 4-hydroxythreonine-4-phosphate dehydrogenase PdxA [Spirochaetia bacterium]